MSNFVTIMIIIAVALSCCFVSAILCTCGKWCGNLLADVLCCWWCCPKTFRKTGGSRDRSTWAWAQRYWPFYNNKTEVIVYPKPTDPNSDPDDSSNISRIEKGAPTKPSNANYNLPLLPSLKTVTDDEENARPSQLRRKL
jgi:hypothetical protein